MTRTQVDRNVYESVILPNEPLVVLMNPEYFKCGKDEAKVHLMEIRQLPIIIPLRWKSIFVAQCKKLNFEPNIICVSDSIVQDVLCTKMGLGVAVLPISAKSLLTDAKLICKKLVDPEISTHTVVAWLKNRTLSSSSSHFLALFKEMFVPTAGRN